MVVEFVTFDWIEKTKDIFLSNQSVTILVVKMIADWTDSNLVAGGGGDGQRAGT